MAAFYGTIPALLFPFYSLFHLNTQQFTHSEGDLWSIFFPPDLPSFSPTSFTHFVERPMDQTSRSSSVTIVTPCYLRWCSWSMHVFNPVWMQICLCVSHCLPPSPSSPLLLLLCHRSPPPSSLLSSQWLHLVLATSPLRGFLCSLGCQVNSGMSGSF